MNESLKKGQGYWDARANSIYLYSVRQLVTRLGANADSIVDIGSAGCPYVDWFDWIPKRTSLDMNRPYTAETVESVKSDFLTWTPNQTYDIATCLQVLEHVPDAKAFAQKLLMTCNILIVSVPYRWKPGKNVSHVHDPVDETKMRNWFDREPNFSLRVQEVISDSRRLIQVYEHHTEQKWSSLNKRQKMLENNEVL